MIATEQNPLLERGGPCGVVPAQARPGDPDPAQIQVAATSFLSLFSLADGDRARWASGG